MFTKGENIKYLHKSEQNESRWKINKRFIVYTVWAQLSCRLVWWTYGIFDRNLHQTRKRIMEEKLQTLHKPAGHKITMTWRIFPLKFMSYLADELLPTPPWSSGMFRMFPLLRRNKTAAAGKIDNWNNNRKMFCVLVLAKRQRRLNDKQKEDQKKVKKKCSILDDSRWKGSWTCQLNDNVNVRAMSEEGRI